MKKRKGGHRHHKPKDDCSLPENEDKPHCTFKHKPRYYSKTSPSRSNQPLTPLGYAQFYLPYVDQQTHTAPEWSIEYTTFKIAHLLPNASSPEGPLPPVPLHLLPDYSTDPDSYAADRFQHSLKKITPWKMKDLTIGAYVKLARKLVAERKMWNKFSEIMWVLPCSAAAG